MSINILDYQRDLKAKAYRVHVAGMEAMDVLQELYLHILEVQHKYDPARSGPRTFIVRVATNKIRDLMRRASAKKRGLYETVSLDELIENDPTFDVAYES